MDISPKALRNARDQFDAMLKRKTKESDWQTFFAAHPYVLTPSLPLRLEPRDIIPLGRPGKSETDFIFYSNRVLGAPFYGLIEIKRPDQKIATIYRKNTAILTRDADGAIKQSQKDIMDVPRRLAERGHIISDANLILGANNYLFVIIGKSDDKIFQPDNALRLKSIRDDLPDNLKILPYDVLFRNFDKSIYLQIHILVPQSPTATGLIQLRSQPTTLSYEDVRNMLREKGFYDMDSHFIGTGIKHQYQRQGNGRVLDDSATGLRWQYGGSPDWMTFEEAQNYIAQLNREGFSGHSDWRLPTLEEAMSLMEPKKKHDQLNINTVFDRTQASIWTEDKTPSGDMWIANFSNGSCTDYNVRYGDHFVRAVRP